MKKILTFLTVVFCMTVFQPVQAQDALVVITHGAPSKAWNTSVLALEQQVTDALKAKGLEGKFSYVRVALMEFASPTIADVVKDCEKKGIRRIYAVPLFIAPSSHSEQDVPNILGLKCDAPTLATLKEEKAQLVSTDIHITVGPTLYYTDTIKHIIADRVSSLAKDKKDCTFILLAHGDLDYYPFYNRLLDSAGRLVQQHTDIPFGGYATVGMGQEFYRDMLPAVQRAAATGHKTILVQGIYLSSGVQELAMMGNMSQGHQQYKDQFPKNVDIVYSSEALLPDLRIAAWIADRGKEWLECR